MPDRYDIRPDETGWEVCDRKGVRSIREARAIRGGLRVEDADEIAYEMSHDPDFGDASSNCS
jgi:hypothetical protein